MTGDKQYLFVNEHKDAPICLSRPIGTPAIIMTDGEVVTLTEVDQQHPAIAQWIRNGELAKQSGTPLKPRLDLVEKSPNAESQGSTPASPSPVPEPKVAAPADTPQSLAFKVKLMNAQELIDFAKGEYQMELNEKQTLANLQAEFWAKYEALNPGEVTSG